MNLDIVRKIKHKNISDIYQFIVSNCCIGSKHKKDMQDIYFPWQHAQQKKKEKNKKNKVVLISDCK